MSMIAEAGQSTEKQNHLRGLFFATVTDNNDPMRLKRLLVNIPMVYGTDSLWALPEGDDWGGGSSGRGSVEIPDNGSTVYVRFQDGNLQHPMWTGTANAYNVPLPQPLLENYPNRTGKGWPDGMHYYYDRQQRVFFMRDSHGNRLRLDQNGIDLVSPVHIDMTAPTTRMTTDLTVVGNVDITIDLEVDRDAYIRRHLYVDGDSRTRDLHVEGTLEVDDRTLMHDTLRVEGNTNLEQNLDVGGNERVQGNMEVLGTSTLQDVLTVNADSDLNGQLDVEQATLLQSTLEVAGTSTLQDDLTVNANSDLNGTLNVQDATLLQNTLDVVGRTTLEDVLEVNANTTFNGRVKIDDPAFPSVNPGPNTWNDTLLANGEILITGKVKIIDPARSDPSPGSFVESLLVLGLIDLSDNVKIDGTVALTGNVTANGTTLPQP